MHQHVVVVGGGVIGLTSAWALLEAGQRVTLVERAPAFAQGASRANGGQLSYRYVSPLADAGVPLKALAWLLDPDGPLRFRPEASLAQWSWLANFLMRCRAAVNREATERLLRLGALSQQVFRDWQQAAPMDAIALREPGKLVVYRDPQVFARVRDKLNGDGLEQALDRSACLALEPALEGGGAELAGGIFTPGEAVADCHAYSLALAARVQAHPRFAGQWQAEAQGWRIEAGRVCALRTDRGELGGDAFLIAAGLHSRELAQAAGIALPLYPLKGYSLTAPIGAQHRPPEISVTDFERKVLYARMGDKLRVAAMVDLVGDDERLDAKRLATLHRQVRQLFPQAADYAHAEPWAGLRPATPSGVPILGATPLQGLWLNVGHGALGFTFSCGSAQIVSQLISGRESPLPLDGLTLRP
jgi:D-amino-acid dehydrogenase